MALVNEVVAVCRSVLDFVSKIENVKEDWFTASDEYQSEAAILRSRLSSYVKELSIHQQPPDSTMMKTLKRAESTLKRAEARLTSLEERVNSDQSCSHIWWLYARLSATFLPELLQNTLKKVNQDLDSIPQILKAEKEFSGLMQDADQNRAISTTVHNNDSKYVPIERSQTEVITAIEDADGPRMILLHGGIGKGKSTLARYMCERYGQFGEKTEVFDHVIVVSCGNCSISDLATKQYEILEQLSPTSLTDKSTSKSTENVGSKSRIAKALQAFFIGKKILTVLDDVSDKDFLYKMWEAARDGEDDKILITSQRSNLCDDFKDDSVLIKMGDPDEEEARKILASLVGLDNQIIPTHLQGIADKMIKATDGNPLALACLASNFAYNPDRKNKRDWQDAWMELSKQLENKETTIVLGRNGETTPRSLWQTMKLCIDSLETTDAKRTLFLIYACKGESVPEEVLRILCAGMKMSSSSFKRSRDELCMRELLKPTGDTLVSKMNLDLTHEDLQMPSAPAWCLQSLVKLYMESHEAGEEEILMMRAVTGALLGDDDLLPGSNITSKVHEHKTEIVETEEGGRSDGMRVIIALCALYFNRQHSDEVVSCSVSKACKISSLVDSDDSINDLRKKAIEPLIWLLDQPEEEDEWTEFHKCQVRKVLLEYICKHQLDTENISCLLNLSAYPPAQLATLMAIDRMSWLEEMPLINENSIRFLEVVIHLLTLEQGVHPSVQEAASNALGSVCWKAISDESIKFVANIPDILGLLAQSLAMSKSDGLFAENAALALGSLACGDEDEVQKIAEKEGILAGLVNYLCQQSKLSLQEAAAFALRNISCSNNVSIEWRIVNTEGAVAGLVNCLSKHDCNYLQRQAAETLRNLAASHDHSLRLRVLKEEGVLDGVVNCLSNEDPELQADAARIVASLADAPDARAVLKRTEGLSKGLSTLVGEDVTPETRDVAARALFAIDLPQAIQLGLLAAQLDTYALSCRIFVKAELRDFQGALDDANQAVTMTPCDRRFLLQERGVLKRMMGDLEGALADLDEALELDMNDYETMKHRGYVKFLLNDMEGARVDAERALMIQTSRLDNDNYLGGTPVEYLGYKL